PTGGVGVAISDTSTCLTVPTSITIAAGASSGSFTATAGTISSGQTAGVTASLNGGSSSTSVSLVPPGTTAGLVAAYAFNEGSGTTTVDASGNGNSGEISGATWTTGGRYDNALQFNGSNAMPWRSAIQRGRCPTSGNRYRRAAGGT